MNLNFDSQGRPISQKETDPFTSNLLFLLFVNKCSDFVLSIVKLPINKIQKKADSVHHGTNVLLVKKCH